MSRIEVFEKLPVLSQRAFVGRISQTVSSKEELFDAVAEALEFPGYFGRNWDALSECLRDLHWCEERDVVLVHDEVLNLPASDRRVYLDVLEEAIADWDKDSEHSLRVLMREGG